MGIERVAFALGFELGLPIPETYLERVNGHDGSLQLRIPDVRPWTMVDATPMLMHKVVNEDILPLGVVFDIWMANPDRVPRNLVQQPLPEGVRTAIASSSKTWLVDHGLCGLWFPSKFGASTVGSVTVGDGSMTADVEAGARRVMPQRYRKAFTDLTADKRRIYLDRVAAVTDDAIHTAVEAVPDRYIATNEAEKTIDLLVARRNRISELSAQHW